MEHQDYWKSKLTPFDSELAMMVESLTENPVELKNGGEHYFFEADYSKHNDPEWICAVMDAIDGRAGKRLVEIKDEPEKHCLLVVVNFSDEKLPGLVEKIDYSDAKPNSGDIYCRQLEEIRAMQVTRENVDRLCQFVGNGQMEIEKKLGGKAVFHFVNNGSVYAHVNEFDYLVYVNHGLFKVVSRETFEKEYEKKHTN